jgi:KUP system potassium uptake protein
MSGNPHGTPPVLLHNLKHNQVLHKTVVFLTVLTEEVPYIAKEKRLEVKSIGNGIYQVLAHYGFMESPHVPEILDRCNVDGLSLNMMTTTFFLGREMLLPSKRKAKGLATWRKRLFAFMSRNAQAATTFFEIPPGQVVELGIRVEL